MIANVLPSHETMPEWMNSNSSVADGLRMCVCGSPLPIVGFAGSETSHSWPSPAHEPTASFLAMNTCTSWHAWKPRLNVVSSLSGFSRSLNANWPPGALTSMIEIFLCGVAQGRKSPGPVGAVMPAAQRIRGDVDVGLVAAGHERVRVRAARRLDHVEELRRGRVRHVEDAHALVAGATALDAIGAVTLEQSSAVWPESIDWNRKRLPPIS